MENKFRVRKTDNSFNTWTVADGDCFTNSRQYISEDGKIAKICEVFDTEYAAQTALDLYLEKRIENQTITKLKQKSVEGTTEMREFAGGATRDADTTKLDIEGFNNPLVDKCYANYLNKHRQTANGLRDSDNWQSLFGEKHLDVCMKSLCRHVLDARLAHRGYKSEQPIIDSLNAVIFNAKAYLFKLLLDAEKQESKPGYGGNVDA